ncbi:hypothetical protein K8354_17470 [Polaribacter litorisediminis]|uniref:hypothetical protein n=1 Tax=Polaribacter litorisediminis TaxID=1908341 RepID=UPI001CBC595D|nr:hypothetical protein [Polaribacter litorisediminis]UAM98050.1 hypothetical protein K8354_17470 [Polaribacter litorisediminis]
MKKFKKNFFSLSLMFSMILGVCISLIPNEAEALVVLGKTKCYQQVTSGAPGDVANFCSGSVCKEKDGVGSNWNNCG